MPLFVLGLNHQTAPVAVRERVAVAAEELSAVLVDLLQQPGIEEAAVLSTCNRTEIYCQGEFCVRHRLASWLAENRGMPISQLKHYLYLHADDSAVRHLFRVATGLDSLVLGEPQILGQTKEAYQAARAAGALKPALERLFQRSFAVAKRVRTDTRIGAHPVSIAFAAVRLAEQVFADLRAATVLLIGAGDTIELAARHLVDRQAQRILVANRTLEHAQQLAGRVGGFALPLADLDNHLADADIVISATAARVPIIQRASIKQALERRRQQPMFLLDLAVPRDIEAEAATLENIYLYTLDDLEQVIAENRHYRQEAAQQAEAIIDLEVGHYFAWWRGSVRQDTLRQLRARMEATRAEVLERARDMLACGQPPEQIIAFVAHALTNKLLHAPSTQLRLAAQAGDEDFLRTAARLFDITVTTDSE